MAACSLLARLRSCGIRLAGHSPTAGDEAAAAEELRNFAPDDRLLSVHPNSETASTIEVPLDGADGQSLQVSADLDTLPSQGQAVSPANSIHSEPLLSQSELCPTPLYDINGHPFVHSVPTSEQGQHVRWLKSVKAMLTRAEYESFTAGMRRFLDAKTKYDRATQYADSNGVGSSLENLLEVMRALARCFSAAVAANRIDPSLTIGFQSVLSPKWRRHWLKIVEAELRSAKAFHAHRATSASGVPEVEPETTQSAEVGMVSSVADLSPYVSTSFPVKSSAEVCDRQEEQSEKPQVEGLTTNMPPATPVVTTSSPPRRPRLQKIILEFDASLGQLVERESATVEMGESMTQLANGDGTEGESNSNLTITSAVQETTPNAQFIENTQGEIQFPSGPQWSLPSTKEPEKQFKSAVRHAHAEQTGSNISTTAVAHMLLSPPATRSVRSKERDEPVLDVSVAKTSKIEPTLKPAESERLTPTIKVPTPSSATSHGRKRLRGKVTRSSPTKNNHVSTTLTPQRRPRHSGTASSSPVFERENIAQEECAICCEDVPPGRAYRLNCRHGWYCADCIHRHAEARLQLGAITVPCPECNTAIPERDLRRVLPKDIIDRLQARSLEQAVSGYSNLRTCPTPNCPMRVAVEEGEIPRLKCPLCQRESCLQCGAQPYHKRLTCEQYAAKRKRSSLDREAELAEEGFRRWMEETGTKQCPKCGAPISKENLDKQATQHAECHKMLCRICNTRFCFKCLAILTDKYSCGCTNHAHGFVNPFTGKRVNHLRLSIQSAKQVKRGEK